MRQTDWEPVTRGRLVAFAAGLVVFLCLALRGEPGFLIPLDYANLLFHEAGHPIVGLVSQRLEPYGGTLGQLVFPIALAISFWRKGQSIGVAASGIWFFENWWNIARYMADARALELPLVGGGDHDWNTIFTRWNILQYDIQISAVVKWGGWVGVGLSLAWLAWRAIRDRDQPPREALGDLALMRGANIGREP